MSDANNTTIAFKKEATYGVLPGSPIFKKLRFTGESLAHAKDTVLSEEIRSDRQRIDLAEVGAQAEGGLDLELSYLEYQEFFQGFLCASWVTIAITQTLAIDESSETLTGTAGQLSALLAGGFVRVSGAVTGANNGIKRVVSINGDGSVATFAAGSFSADEASPTITLAGKDLRNGIERHSWTLERDVLAASGTHYFQSYAGMMANVLEVSMRSKEIVTGSMSFLGTKGLPAGATVSTGGAPTATTTDPVMNGTSHIGQLWQDAALMTEKLKEWTFSINNNLRGKDALGVRGNFDIGLGSIDVTGKISAYFKDNTLYTALVNHSYSGLAVVITDSAGNSLCFTFPRVNFGAGDPQATGINTDVMVDVDFTAIRDTTLGVTVIVNAIAAP